MTKVVSFDFAKDDVLSLLSTREIGSVHVDANPVNLELKPGIKIEAAEVVVTAGSALAVQTFNSADDVDADGVWQGQPTREAHDTELPALLSLSEGEAWLKYRLEGTLKAKVATSLAAAGFEIDAEAGAIFADYRVHTRHKSVRDAFVQDTAEGVRFALDLATVEKLSANEAVTFQGRGKLSTAVTVAFSDIFTAQAASLLTFAGVTKSVGFKVNAGASVTFRVAVSDEFIVSFARVNDATWRVGVRKAKSRQTGLTFAATIDVEASDPAALNAFITEIKDALLGAPMSQVEAALSKPLDQLNEGEDGLVKTLLTRFGLTDAHDVRTALRERVEAIDKNLAKTLKQVAESKIRLGFAYEYSRLREDMQLLQMELNREHLQRFHKDLLRGRVQTALEALAQGEPGMTLNTYLNQRTLKREKSWGFSLGIGKWVNVGGRDSDKMSVVQRRNFAGAVQESYLGTRGYEGKWIGETFRWAADFRADMRGYSQARVPVVSEFDLGLHLAFEATQKQLSAGEIDDYLDLASLWGIVGEEQLNERRAQLLEFKNTAYTISVQLTVPDEAFRLLLPRLTVASDVDLAGPLAAAMPRRDASGLRTPSERARTFLEAWRFCLAHPDLDTVDRRHAIANLFRNAGHPELAMFEGRASDGVQFGFTVTGRISLDGHPINAWREFRNGAALLSDGLRSNQPAQTVLERARRSMRHSWTQVHRLRAIGTLLLRQADTAGVLSKVGRSMLVTPTHHNGAAQRGMVLLG